MEQNKLDAIQDAAMQEFLRITEELLEKADNGDKAALTQLHSMQNTMPSMPAKLAEIYGTIQGNAIPYAQYNIGTYYQYGKGRKKDMIKAVYWWQKSANGGNAFAMVDLGCCYYNGIGIKQDIPQAIYWWEKAADKGQEGAFYNLGICYRDGKGVRKDFDEAALFFAKAGEQRHADALGNLCYIAECYIKGQNVTQNIEKGIRYFTVAAEYGQADAQAKLGVFYYQGIGVKSNMGTAKMWLQRAASNGNIMAQKALAELF